MLKITLSRRQLLTPKLSTIKDTGTPRNGPLRMHALCCLFYSFPTHVLAQVTDSSLEIIGKHCTGLTSLMLQGCERVSDEGLEALLSGCPNLTALNLRGVTDLSEVFLTCAALNVDDGGQQKTGNR